MAKEYVKMVAKRFGKAFLAGGLGSLSVQLVQAHSIHTLTDLKTWAIASAVAFIGGGIMAAEKALQSSNPQ